MYTHKSFSCWKNCKCFQKAFTYMRIIQSASRSFAFSVSLCSKQHIAPACMRRKYEHMLVGLVLYHLTVRICHVQNGNRYFFCRSKYVVSKVESSFRLPVHTFQSWQGRLRGGHNHCSTMIIRSERKISSAVPRNLH